MCANNLLLVKYFTTTDDHHVLQERTTNINQQIMNILIQIWILMSLTSNKFLPLSSATVHIHKSWTKDCICYFSLLCHTLFTKGAANVTRQKRSEHTRKNRHFLLQKIRWMTTLADSIVTRFQTHSCMCILCDKDWKSVLTNLSSQRKNSLHKVISQWRHRGVLVRARPTGPAPVSLHNEHVQSILQAPIMKGNNGKELHKVDDTCKQHIQAIKLSDHYSSDMFLTIALELKMDEVTRLKWMEYSNDSQTTPPYSELL